MQPVQPQSQAALPNSPVQDRCIVGGLVVGAAGVGLNILGAPVLLGGMLVAGGIRGVLYAAGSHPQQVNEDVFITEMVDGGLYSLIGGGVSFAVKSIAQPFFSLGKAAANILGQSSANAVTHCAERAVNQQPITLRGVVTAGASGAAGGLAVEAVRVRLGEVPNVPSSILARGTAEGGASAGAASLTNIASNSLARVANNYSEGRPLTQDLSQDLSVQRLVGDTALGGFTGFINAIPDALNSARVVPDPDRVALDEQKKDLDNRQKELDAQDADISKNEKAIIQEFKELAGNKDNPDVIVKADGFKINDRDEAIKCILDGSKVVEVLYGEPKKGQHIHPFTRVFVNNLASQRRDLDRNRADLNRNRAELDRSQADLARNQSSNAQADFGNQRELNSTVRQQATLAVIETVPPRQPLQQTVQPLLQAARGLLQPGSAQSVLAQEPVAPTATPAPQATAATVAPAAPTATPSPRATAQPAVTPPMAAQADDRLAELIVVFRPRVDDLERRRIDLDAEDASIAVKEGKYRAGKEKVISLVDIVLDGNKKAWLWWKGDRIDRTMLEDTNQLIEDMLEGVGDVKIHFEWDGTTHRIPPLENPAAARAAWRVKNENYQRDERALKVEVWHARFDAPRMKKENQRDASAVKAQQEMHATVASAAPAPQAPAQLEVMPPMAAPAAPIAAPAQIAVTPPKVATAADLQAAQHVIARDALNWAKEKAVGHIQRLTEQREHCATGSKGREKKHSLTQQIDAHNERLERLRNLN